MIDFINKIFFKFWNASKGFYILLKEEKSLLFHLFATVTVLILGVVFNIESTEWLILILTIGLVISMEIMNTGLEYLVDLVSFEYNLKAKKVKDLAAAATLFSALLSLVVGLVIFMPYFLGTAI